VSVFVVLFLVWLIPFRVVKMKAIFLFKSRKYHDSFTTIKYLASFRKNVGVVTELCVDCVKVRITHSIYKTNDFVVFLLSIGYTMFIISNSEFLCIVQSQNLP